MKKTFIVFFTMLISMAAFSSTAVINFTGKTTKGASCDLDKVVVENITQGWSETIRDVSISIELIDNNEAIEAVPVNQDFSVVNNAYEGKAQVFFDLTKGGQVSVFVYDIAGRCVCQSITEQEAGHHMLNLEFSTPQMYFLHISTPSKNFSHSLLNLHTGSVHQVYYTEMNINKGPVRVSANNTCNVGDEMRYTGYTTLNNNEYTDKYNATIQEGVSNVVFEFEVAQQADYYIKHPWGTGDDADWSWQPMEKNGDSYTYTGLWGGVGANINTSDDDSGAEWYAASGISGASSLSIGDEVIFTFKPSNGAVGRLSVSRVGGSTPGDDPETADYYIKHPWGTGDDADWSWKPMVKNGNYYTYTGLWGGVGANINSMAADPGAEWYAASSISGASYLSIGDEVIFKYNPSISLSVEKVSQNPDPFEILPAAPTGLKVTDENDYRIEISWNAVENAYYYQVYRATTKSGTYTKLGGYTQARTYMDVSVTTGSTYYYKVSAINGVGEGPQSAAVSGTALGSGGGGGGTTTLAAPTGVTATPGTSSITVKWNSVSGASKYNVYRSTSSSGTYSKIATEYGTSHIDMNVSSGSTYYYKVAAVSSTGTEGTKSSAASATLGGGGGGTTTVAAPTNVKASYMLGQHQVQVTWSEVPLCDSYEIYRSNSSSSNGSKIGTATNSSGMVYVDKLSSSVDQTTYYYRVKAKSSNLGKTSDYSEPASVYIDKNPVAPCAPLNVRITGSSSVTISWTINTASGCGTPTTKKVQIADDSNGGKWVDKVVTTNSCSLTSTEVKKYTNGGNELNLVIMLQNPSGSACMYFIYNVSTQTITHKEVTSCY